MKSPTTISFVGFKTIRTGGLAVIGLALAMLVANTASGLTVSVTNARKYYSGPARVVEMQGTYRRTAGEKRVPNLWVVMLDANYREVSRAQGRTGTVNGRYRNWSAGVGDFRGVYYFAEFRVTTASGDRYFRTPRQRW